MLCLSGDCVLRNLLKYLYLPNVKKPTNPKWRGSHRSRGKGGCQHLRVLEPSRALTVLRLVLTMSHPWGGRGQSESWDPQRQRMYVALTRPVKAGSAGVAQRGQEPLPGRVWWDAPLLQCSAPGGQAAPLSQGGFLLPGKTCSLRPLNQPVSQKPVCRRSLAQAMVQARCRCPSVGRTG